jgi:hypothetical protein
MAIPALLLEFVVLKGLGWVLVKTRLKAQPPGIMQQVTRASSRARCVRFARHNHADRHRRCAF